MSLLAGITAVNKSTILLRGGGNRERFGAPLWHPESQDSLKKTARWIIVYLPGMFAGMVGTMSLISQNWNHRGVVKLTVAFYTIVGIGILLAIILVFARGKFWPLFTQIGH
ncbi:hypothetical protein AX16_001649 [Volvariella volvacea WC 439]|nr:hypothetical protein AX16_001649 [Volvariella volvacea WC 439]